MHIANAKKSWNFAFWGNVCSHMLYVMIFVFNSLKSKVHYIVNNAAFLMHLHVEKYVLWCTFKKKYRVSTVTLTDLNTLP